MARRPRTSLLALGVALLGLVLSTAGCRTSPGVAAYVGDAQVTTDELSTAVDARLADPAVAAYAASLPAGDFTRQVLNLMLGEQVYDVVEQRYDVQVGAADVQDRITELLAGQDEGQLYAQLAQQQGLLPDDAREIIRQLLIREDVAQAAGLADLTEAGIRAGYADAAASGEQFELGYLTVPDQATADAVAAQLRADPASYAALAAQYAGQYTVAAPQLQSIDQVPSVLADPIRSVLPAGVFTLPVAEAGGVLVGQVTAPPFEALAGDLTSTARKAASDAAKPLVDEVRAGLDVTVNPRYGTLQDGSVVAGDGVVTVLEDGAVAPGSPAGN